MQEVVYSCNWYRVTLYRENCMYAITIYTSYNYYYKTQYYSNVELMPTADGKMYTLILYLLYILNYICIKHNNNIWVWNNNGIVSRRILTNDIFNEQKNQMTYSKIQKKKKRKEEIINKRTEYSKQICSRRRKKV